MGRLSKHDLYVHQLCSVIDSEYDLILTHVPMYRVDRRKRRLIGEIDVLAMRGSQCDVFEVKCSPRLVKARLQLNKIRRHGMIPVSRLFFYWGGGARLFEI